MMHRWRRLVCLKLERLSKNDPELIKNRLSHQNGYTENLQSLENM